MDTVGDANRRIVSGMRPTGQMHLGHLHGVLRNWVRLQHEYECFFFAADWHALTTHYEDTRAIEPDMWAMIVDWLAVGIDPGVATIFIQSRVPEHAELHLLLSMLTPLSWLERVPTYKEQQEKLKERDLSTYGFLGYPLLMSADVLAYRAGRVPVGEDQVVHVEMTREIARRFNYIYGREPDFEERVQAAIKKLGRKAGSVYREQRRKYQERGDTEALAVARALLTNQNNLTIRDRERLLGYLEGSGRTILVEPQSLLTETPKMPGIDGQKMSKSYGNTISLREESESIEKKVRTMPTDPARVRRNDPGEPTKCPVWDFHKIYSNEETQQWVQEGCRSAGIGCIDCKMAMLKPMLAELEPIRERGKEIEADSERVRGVIADGNEAARDVARDTLEVVRESMRLNYR